MSEASTTPQAAAAPQAEERRRLDRRKHPRYPVAGGGAEIRLQGVDSRIWARLTDISLGGCYLEIMSPLPVLTYVNLALTLEGQRLQAKGQVAVSHPLRHGDSVHRSERARPPHTRELDRGPGGPGRASGRAPRRREPGAHSRQGAAALLVQSVTEFFRNKPVMSREEFLQMLEAHRKSQEEDKAEALRPA